MVGFGYIIIVFRFYMNNFNQLIRLFLASGFAVFVFEKCCKFCFGKFLLICYFYIFGFEISTLRRDCLFNTLIITNFTENPLFKENFEIMKIFYNNF